MTQETDRQMLLLHTADRAMENKEAITTIQDVLHDQQQLIVHLAEQLESMQQEIQRQAQFLPDEPG